MSSAPIVVTADPSVVVSQDNPALQIVVPVTTAPTQYSSLAGLPHLGTAAAQDVGVGVGDIVQLDLSGKLPAVDGSALTNLNVASQPVHCGRLIFANSTTLLLIPYRGCALQINGKLYQIPPNGLGVTATGLTPSTMYYVYAYVDGTGAIALEFSQTTHAPLGNLGVEVKLGDDTRSLVGMVYNTASGFQDSTTARCVASWFNQRPRSLLKFTGGQYTTTTASFTEMGGGAERVQFISWASTSRAARVQSDDRSRRQRNERWHVMA
ncbi:hypothetical protein HAP48_0004220 [Bradyrhizobium septentrionale]|uniref:Uncharacterized protein n=1 Tax=Bradyrhizobium septentrionale TaxID=1404411 RepID=A0A973W5N9_9BRAD|nr:hypothetical protein [Bradyrhizobium septentrionale]UGY16759.1 hypothetical protein HAP48_0004220 [Bradyrhizobium septentrionale]